MSQNYTISGIDQKLWNEFMSACRHYDHTARASFLKHIQTVVNTFRTYKMNYGDTVFLKGGKRRK